MLTCITCSTGRPKSFRILEECVKGQTYFPLRWLICGENLTGYSFDLPFQKIVERDRSNDPPGVHSYCLNMLHALKHVETPYVLILEDEDYYAPTWLSDAYEALLENHVIGIRQEIYYYMESQKVEFFRNDTCATMATTGFDWRATERLKEQIIKHPHGTFDTPFWAKIKGKKRLIDNVYVGGIRHISFKQLRETEPITCHDVATNAEPDINMQWLKKNCPTWKDYLTLAQGL